MKRKIIPYTPQALERAKQLRKNMTYSEVKLWMELRNGGMMGYDFDRQKPILNYIVDFYCKDLMLAIEVDGVTHDNEKAVVKDEIRQEEIEIYGVSFLRFNALDVVHDLKNVLRTIENWIFGFEEKNGVNEFVIRKRNSLQFPRERKRKDPPQPLRGGDSPTVE
ncbi:MAG: endonuclease domain-containing protein [Chitinophagaceae bacterium]|nr:endonuclease domain-containing protein [Chitinophagaceae bacterium]